VRVCVCVCACAGGLFVGLPEQIPRSCILTEADLQYYVSQYEEQGFRSGVTHPLTSDLWTVSEQEAGSSVSLQVAVHSEYIRVPERFFSFAGGR